MPQDVGADLLAGQPDNLASRTAELPLQRWEGKAPIELLGRVPFPRIGELPYFVTLAPYGFYWFELVDPLPAALP